MTILQGILSEQAARRHEYRSLTTDVYRKSFERRASLWFQNESSDVVRFPMKTLL